MFGNSSFATSSTMLIFHNILGTLVAVSRIILRFDQYQSKQGQGRVMVITMVTSCFFNNIKNIINRWTVFTVPLYKQTNWFLFGVMLYILPIMLAKCKQFYLVLLPVLLFLLLFYIGKKYRKVSMDQLKCCTFSCKRALKWSNGTFSALNFYTYFWSFKIKLHCNNSSITDQGRRWYPYFGKSSWTLPLQFLLFYIFKSLFIINLLQP